MFVEQLTLREAQLEYNGLKVRLAIAVRNGRRIIKALGADVDIVRISKRLKPLTRQLRAIGARKYTVISKHAVMDKRDFLKLRQTYTNTLSKGDLDNIRKDIIQDALKALNGKLRKLRHIPMSMVEEIS